MALVIAAFSLLLVWSIPPVAAQEGSDGCGEGSTSGVIVTAVNTITGNAARVEEQGSQHPPLRFTLTAQVDKQGNPHANLVFPQGILGVESNLVHFEIHRLFIQDESHESLTQLLAQGECGDDTGCDDGCGGDEGGDGCGGEHGDALGVGIRGLGTLANGEQVRVHIDLQDRGTDQNVDRFRIRWRPAGDHGQGEDHVSAAQAGECEGGWLFNSGWTTAKQVDIKQK